MRLLTDVILFLLSISLISLLNKNVYNRMQMVYFILIYHLDSNMMISLLLALSFVHCINVSDPIVYICLAKINHS